MMALPTMNAALAKKKRPSLDELADERMSLAPKATSATAVNEVAKPMADAARQGMAGVSKPGAPPKGPSTSARPADPLDDLARERMAAAGEIDAANAKQQMDQRSRAGLGGLGLSGAASAAAGDLGRQQARTKALTMADFDKMAEDRAFTDVQRDAALADYEDAYGADINGDGRIGGFTNSKTGEVEGGTIEQGANQSDAEYVAAVLNDNASQEAKRYPDALVREMSVADAVRDHGRPIAGDAQYQYFKDFETGVVFKVRKA
jgi:hypothetical protein